ncbi:RlpA-like double-psi beta-barrel-protein domain-containing protein-containing protein [Phascolomyces articulosus]|uniref:RlpA-like double-psi beta-barrel-protein domain-containing protein-containing protein n=1 Tax=Phascolomyces articulosus TaxID=60185 RepID=A0AAD5KBA1_9FUNG|nr:RlpA-like double-psi beta-barrel-protein domain-containing protein-containing protein [Phascolomyces articulosus]
MDKRESFSGKGTWFIPSLHGGSMGACWEYEADDEYVVAMNSVQYGEMTTKSDWCFKKVRIYNGGKHVDAVVKDACPECKYGDLDLTPPVFKALGDLDTGILKITWHEI